MGLVAEETRKGILQAKLRAAMSATATPSPSSYLGPGRITEGWGNGHYAEGEQQGVPGTGTSSLE